MFNDNSHDEVDYAYDDRFEFLKSSKAVPTPFAAQALWLAVWMRADKRNAETVNVVDRNYAPVGMVQAISTGSVMPRNLAVAMGHNENDLVEFDSENISYSDKTWDYWTPTESHVTVPEGYGADSMTILVLKDHADVIAVPYTDRKGWEYGHSALRTLEGDLKNGFVATTNECRVKATQDMYAAARHPDAVRKLVKMLESNTTFAGEIVS